MFKKVLLLLAILVVAGGTWIYSKIDSLSEQVLAVSAPSVITVEKGMGAYEFAQMLEQLGWIEDARWMKALYRLKPELAAIKAGEYQVEPKMTLAALYERVTAGDSIQYRITLIEGSTVKEILALLAESDTLIKTLSSSDTNALAEELELDYASAEGLFLAETYLYERGTTDKALLLRAHRMLQSELEALWDARDKELPLNSAYEALTLASIIEKETGLASERPEIAGVFIRRLNLGMRMQTDPTVIYGMGDRYTGNITRKDLRTATAFNTYVINGLPPTPIATVGREAIYAALNPLEGKSLYFVARGDGSHQFSETLDQHNRAVREYQLKRRSDYRSAPGGG